MKRACIIGFCVAAVLFSLGYGLDEWRWWVIAVSLNTAFNV
jgi:hypothetical protein